MVTIASVETKILERANNKRKLELVAISQKRYLYVPHSLESGVPECSSSSLLLSGLELSDTKVCESLIRARLGTTAHFCKVVVVKFLKKILERANNKRKLELVAISQKRYCLPPP